jgi:hypothetical protein
VREKEVGSIAEEQTNVKSHWIGENKVWEGEKRHNFVIWFLRLRPLVLLVKSSNLKEFF